MRRVLTIPLLVMIGGIAACGGSPTTNSPPPPPPVVLAQFIDPQSGFQTSDVYDVQDQVVQFDINNRALIWKADARSFPGFTVSGNLINANFQVRFGIKNGGPRAYFTETATGTICDIEIVNGQVVITATNVPVPGPGPVQLATFTDAGQVTSDVYDVDDQIVQFDITNHTLIWKADGRTFTGFTVNGNIVNVDFQVRFGHKNGVWHAYFTETARPFVCNIEIVNGQLSITATNVPVPDGQGDTPCAGGLSTGAMNR